MTPAKKPVPVRREDPAGLDKLLIAAGKGCARFLEAFAQSKGVSLNLWDGKDGMGAVLEEAVKRVPNKRLPELVTPRSILEQAGVIKRRGHRRIKAK